MTWNEVLKRRFSAATIVAGMAMSVSAGLASPASADDADQIVKRMSDYVAGQKTVSFTFDTEIEIVTPQGQKVQFDSSGEASISRPDKFLARRTGGYADVELVADGKSVTLLGKNTNKFVQVPADGSIDAVIDELRTKYGAELPAADLLAADSYRALMEGVIDAKHIGTGIVDGVECEHLAFRNIETDWQLWVQSGDKPIPRKYVITSKTVGESPQYTIRIKDWKTDTAFAPDAFAFKPPAGAEGVEIASLHEFDEIPESSPLGAQQ